jgi:DNA-binding MarR family transcriptional regulator
VTREPHPRDRRATLVTFTRRGKTLAARLQRDHQALARALFDAMPSRDFEAFARGLAEVVAKLRGHVGSPS